MNKVEQSISLGFSARWVILCGLGLGAGLFVGLALASPIGAIVGMMLVTPVILAIAGSMFGAVQWVAIWRHPRVALLWISASALGLALGMTLGIVLVEMLGRAITGEQVRLLTIGPWGRVVGLAGIGTMTGLAVGTIQWLALRRYSVLGRQWIALCAAGFGVGLPLGGLVGGVLPGGLQSGAGAATFLCLSGLVVGALTVKGAVRMATQWPSPRAI